MQQKFVSTANRYYSNKKQQRWRWRRWQRWQQQQQQQWKTNKLLG